MRETLLGAFVFFCGASDVDPALALPDQRAAGESSMEGTGKIFAMGLAYALFVFWLARRRQS